MDESGARPDRPLLLRAIERIEKQESDGLIVFRLHRFARKVTHGLNLLARIEQVDGEFFSVQENFDLRTRTGRMVMQFLFLIAEWDYEEDRENWDLARSKAVARGIHPSTVAPMGYTRRKGERLRPKPEAAPIIAEAFRMRGAGATMQEVADFMNESGIRSHTGKRLIPARVEIMLKNRAYLGEARSGEFTNPDAHEPMVDAATWQQAQRPRQPRKSRVLLLVGLIRCAGCGRRMVAGLPETTASASGHYYCQGKRANCPSPARARADEIEPLIEDLIFRFALRGGPAGTERMVVDCEAVVSAAQKKLEEYRDNHSLQRTLGMESFEAGVGARQEHLERALRKLAMSRRALERPHVDVIDLEARWESLEMMERRAVVERFLEAIFIERGRAPIRERVWVCRHGRGPLEPSPKPKLQPFEPAKVAAQRVPRPKQWPEQRIERELRSFLGAQGDWPAYPAFEAAGKARLHAQVMAWGGPFYWAGRLGLQIDTNTVRWNAERVRGALKPFLKGRTRWPTEPEFRDAGLEVLRRAVTTHGGVTHWSEEFGLEPPRKRPDKWSKDRVERELREFLGNREGFPTRTELIAEGRSALAAAIANHGGRLYWERRFRTEGRGGPVLSGGEAGDFWRAPAMWRL